MIRDRQTLKMYIDADRFALGKSKRNIKNLLDPIYVFETYLRKYEYYYNTPSTIKAIPRLLYAFLLRRKSIKLGFSIPVNCFGPGLRINHYGLIVINSKCKIGKWCDIHQGVNIGDNGHFEDNAYVEGIPQVGDFCFIGPGAKLFGKINIGNHVQIGANSVVSKSIEDNMTVYGIPITTHKSTKTHNTIASTGFEERFLARYPQYKGMI